MSHFAHSLKSKPPETWEPLAVHLKNVSNRAADFAERFDAKDWGRLAGLWHDVGKYSGEFQAYLYRENGHEAHLEQYDGRVDHATAGAQHAVEVLTGLNQPEAGRLLAYCIAGHHAGLADADDGRRGLNARLRKVVKDWSAAPAELLQADALPFPELSLDYDDEPRMAFQMALFCRMQFSCLVDADFLETEAFYSAARPQSAITLRQLQAALYAHLDRLNSAGPDVGTVHESRQHILSACRDAAEWSPGLFSLTVPTGGGKTLSSLAFALKHAERHMLRRVIYAIPFTSIIEQTADVFRRVFKDIGDDAVLEHHSNLDPEQESHTSRLAAENWDAPIVVTTNVQFFESFFAAKTSKCRKLHRVAGSVIVLDEVQTLPVELLQPCLALLRELSTDYGCTIVLCTATQPAILHRDDFPIGLENVREIIPDPPALYRRMKRVDVESLGPLSDNELTARLEQHEQFLCIVNTRGHASRLFELLKQQRDGAGLFHLSTFLCGEHRSRTIATIRERLCAGKPCRVISTQLIEAGVDVDFPVVYRALTGIDSIAQAAGRCNREGKQTSATVYLFEPTEVRLIGYLKSVADSAAELLPDVDDPLDLDVVTRYFDLHYWKHSDRWDAKQVMECFQEPAKQVFQFRTAAERFRMIEDNTQPVFVPYADEGSKLIEQLRRPSTPENPAVLRKLLRQLQRYSVSLFTNVYESMLTRDIELVHDRFAVIANETMYDDRLGLRLDLAGYHEPETLVI